MKKAMVYGGGVSGMAAFELLKKNGYEPILVDDKKAMNSMEAMENLEGIELFIKSPGIPYNDLVMKVKGMGIELIDEIELAYRMDKSRARIVAVTGTNGKTTTTSKIAGLLEEAGYKVEAGGNIGKPYARIVLEENQLDYIVLELSSYQLENLKSFRADIALVINLSPDHMDRYERVEDYYRSKLNITVNQTSEDRFIYNLDSKELDELTHDFKARKIRVSSKGIKSGDYWVEAGKLLDAEGEILETDKLSLKGKHNLENIMFIVAVAKEAGVDNSIISDYLYRTESLEHRMENFFSINDISFVNDSKGTNIDSTIKAIEAYDRKPVLICGGKDKMVDLRPLARCISESVKKLYLIGQTADQIEALVRETGYENIHNLKELGRVVEELEPEEGDIVLFSPAHSSFDQFANYIERGNEFKRLILKKYK